MEPEKRRFTDSLPCTLTPAELAERADLAAHLDQESDAITDALKAYVQERKAVIAEKDATRKRLQTEVRERRAFKAVDCEEIRDYSAGTVRVVRLDTGEETSSREMNHDERQRAFDLEPKTGRKKPGEPPPERNGALEKSADEEGKRITEESAATTAAKLRNRRKKPEA